jgi:antitoxin ParD1/3/4
LRNRAGVSATENRGLRSLTPIFSVSEYIRELIRDDEKRKAQGRLEALLLEGVQSNGPTEMTRQDWDEVRKEALKQFEARRSRKSA